MLKYQVLFTGKAEKELSKIATVDRNNLLKRFPLLASPFTAPLDIKKMTNISNFYRWRVRKVRVIFEILEKRKEIWIRKIGYRGGIYR